jgi:hypothetical protein
LFFHGDVADRGRTGERQKKKTDMKKKPEKEYKLGIIPTENGLEAGTPSQTNTSLPIGQFTLDHFYAIGNHTSASVPHQICRSVWLNAC